jgi:hypothetical protein
MTPREEAEIEVAAELGFKVEEGLIEGEYLLTVNHEVRQLKVSPEVVSAFRLVVRLTEEKRADRENSQRQTDHIIEQNKYIDLIEGLLTPNEHKEGIINAFRRIVGTYRQWHHEVVVELEEWMVAAFGKELAKSIPMQSMAKLVIGERIARKEIEIKAASEKKEMEGRMEKVREYCSTEEVQPLRRAVILVLLSPHQEGAEG